MSKSNTDARRRELGRIIKQIYRKEEEFREDLVVPEKGCVYYGNIDLMEKYCTRCRDKDCY
jgi:hypothetical protein